VPLELAGERSRTKKAFFFYFSPYSIKEMKKLSRRILTDGTFTVFKEASTPGAEFKL
jgi:hypothetical protein